MAPLISITLHPQDRGPTRGYGHRLRSQPGVLLMTVGFLVLIAWLWKPLPISFSINTNMLMLLLGSLLYFPALCLYFWGLFTLGQQFGVSTYGGAALHKDHRLITHGPFHYCRHPMYLAVIIASLGALLIYQTWVLLLLFPLSLSMLHRATLEEQLLEEVFGERWQRYQAEVPKWFPHIIQ